MEYYSPLRYPGGKRKVADYFKQVFKDNLLYDGIYVEPYAGGASVALSLLFNEYASKIIINDIDRSIYAFWHSVLKQPEVMCKLIYDTPVTMDSWKRQKDIQQNKAMSSLIKLGFATFFLNRTNRSGILNAGVIGGQRQDGTWKLDARFNKKDLVSRIEKIASFSNSIELYNLDAVELIKLVKPNLPKKSLFYFDPPYYIKGRDLYLNYYQDKDHRQIASEIAKLSKHKWIITYDNVAPIQNLYSSFRHAKYSLNYSAAKANRGEEIMIFSDNLFISRHPILNN